MRKKAQASSYFPLITAFLIIFFLVIIYIFFINIFEFGKGKTEIINERLDKKMNNYNFLYSIIYSNLSSDEKSKLEEIGYKNIENFYELFYLYIDADEEKKEEIKKIIENRFDKFYSKYDLQIYLRNESNYKLAFRINKLTTTSWLLEKTAIAYLEGGGYFNIINIITKQHELIEGELIKQAQTSARILLPYSKNKFLSIYVYIE